MEKETHGNKTTITETALSVRATLRILTPDLFTHHRNGRRVLHGAQGRLDGRLHPKLHIRRRPVAGHRRGEARQHDDWEATAELDASERERRILEAGGKLRLTKEQYSEGGSGAAPADD